MRSTRGVEAPVLAAFRQPIDAAGEGQIDFQTQFGKGPGMLAKLAARHGVPVIGIAGSVAENAGELSKKGFTALFSITNQPMDLATAMKEGPQLMERTAEQVARLIRAGTR